MAKKGEKLSEETKAKISIANKGRKCSDETKKKLSEIVTMLWTEPQYVQKTLTGLRKAGEAKRGITRDPEIGKKISARNKGRVITPEWRKNMSVAAKRKYANGYKHPMLGRKVPEHLKKYYSKLFTGRKHTEEDKRKITLAQLGRPSGMLGKHHTPEAIVKISTAQKGVSYISEQGKERLRIKRLHQKFPKKDSKPEKMMQKQLQLHRIKFETQKPITGIPDFFIEPNICVFVDGDFWHGNPAMYKSGYVIRRKPNLITAKDKQEKDRRINEKLKNRGFKVLRFWDSEINQDIEKCVEKILKNV